MTEIINMENIVLDENQIISLQTIYRPMLLHFGSPAGYQRFEFSYFIKKISDPEENFIYKHIIHSVKYEPDKLYSTVDGMAGKCWIVEVFDVENEKSNKYYIRNWIDIVEFYNEKGLKFVVEYA